MDLSLCLVRRLTSCLRGTPPDKGRAYPYPPRLNWPHALLVIYKQEVLLPTLGYQRTRNLMPIFTREKAEQRLSNSLPSHQVYHLPRSSFCHLSLSKFFFFHCNFLICNFLFSCCNAQISIVILVIPTLIINQSAQGIYLFSSIHKEPVRR